MTDATDPWSEPWRCECGCGGDTLWNADRGQWNRFIFGHQRPDTPKPVLPKLPEPPLPDKAHGAEAAIEAWLAEREKIPASTEKALAGELGITRQQVKLLIERARLNLAARAEHYVAAHYESVRLGLAAGDSRGLRVAAQASQWALERIVEDGKRVVEAPQQGPAGSKVIVGIAIGGAAKPEPVIDVEAEDD